MPAKESNMTPAELITRARELIDKYGSYRSDDFGHNTHKLLLAESYALQDLCDNLVLQLTDALEKAELALADRTEKYKIAMDKGVDVLSEDLRRHKLALEYYRTVMEESSRDPTVWAYDHEKVRAILEGKK